MTTAKNTPPYKVLRVLDFSRIIAGPLCTQQLSDMGAEIIKRAPLKMHFFRDCGVSSVLESSCITYHCCPTNF